MFMFETAGGIVLAVCSLARKKNHSAAEHTLLRAGSQCALIEHVACLLA
jgi:hypothetical protein